MKSKFLHVEIPVTFLRESENFIAYSPALDLSTCGKTFEEAKKRFEEASQLFLKEIEKMGTIKEVLTECGWHQTSPPESTWVPPYVIAQETINVSYPHHAT